MVDVWVSGETGQALQPGAFYQATFEGPTDAMRPALRRVGVHTAQDTRGQRATVRALQRQHGCSSRTIGELRAENARLREQLREAGRG